MSQAKLIHDGVEYTITVNSEDGFTTIELDTTRPPLGLSTRLYEFMGRLGTREQERNAAEMQQRASEAPLDQHNFRR